MPGAAIAALEHVTVPLGAGESIACVVNALLLLQDGERRLAALISRRGRELATVVSDPRWTRSAANAGASTAGDAPTARVAQAGATDRSQLPTLRGFRARVLLACG